MSNLVDLGIDWSGMAGSMVVVMALGIATAIALGASVLAIRKAVSYFGGGDGSSEYEEEWEPCSYEEAMEASAAGHAIRGTPDGDYEVQTW